MTNFELRPPAEVLERLQGWELQQALQEPFYEEWKRRGGDDRSCRELLSLASPAQRILFVTWWLENEVSNGGFSALFYNTTGNYLPEITDALRGIGALDHLALLHRAMNLFPDGVPLDHAERNDAWDKLDLDETVLDELDEAFYALERGPTALDVLRQRLIDEHRDDFVC